MLANLSLGTFGDLSTNTIVAILAVAVGVDTLLLLLTLVVLVRTRRRVPIPEAAVDAGAVSLVTSAELEARLAGRSTGEPEPGTGADALETAVDATEAESGAPASRAGLEAAGLLGMAGPSSASSGLSPGRRAVEDVLAEVERAAAAEELGRLDEGEFGGEAALPGHEVAEMLVDRPTGVGSSLAWEHALLSEGHRFARYGRPVTVAIAELAGIERLEQQFGQPASDRVVRAVADTLRRTGRATDDVARLGPARFGILLPETDEVAAINYVERVRAACDRWLEASAVSLRLAVGWASPSANGSLSGALHLASERLYAEERPRSATPPPARRRARAQPEG